MTPTTTTKPFWQSKTVWVQVLAVLSMFIPAVGEWVARNPVEFVAVLGAINTLVRFATHGSVSVFQDDEPGSAEGKGGSSGGSLLLLMIATAAGFIMAGGLLSSCAVGIDEQGNYLLKPDPYAIDAGLKYLIRHEEDEDAKGGAVEWVYYDPKTGKPIDPKDYAAWGIKGTNRGGAEAAEANAE
jgi:hypothetical protein